MLDIPNKIIGWILVGLGIILIFWTIIVSYNIFTGARGVPQIFKLPAKTAQTQEMDASSQLTQGKSEQEIQTQIQKIVQGQLKEQIKGFFPPEFIARILNLGSWSIFAAIMIFASGKISAIGIKLIKMENKNIL